MLEIRYVQSEDKEFWYSLDKHLPEQEFDNKVRDKRGYILLDDNKPIGLLRYNLFWDNTPFCTMLFVEWNYHGKGYGKKLMEHWEKDMKSQGYGMLLTSTQVDEEAQHFYRKLGYKDCGGFVIDILGYEQPMEMFLIKGIQQIPIYRTDAKSTDAGTNQLYRTYSRRDFAAGRSPQIRI